MKNFEELQASIVYWADMHELLKSENAKKQFMKFIEEVFEFKTEFDNFDEIDSDNEFSDGYQEYVEHNLKLEMGDIFVTLIILCEQLNISPQTCLAMAYDKIKVRKGRTINGTFVKEEDL